MKKKKAEKSLKEFTFLKSKPEIILDKCSKSSIINVLIELELSD